MYSGTPAVFFVTLTQYNQKVIIYFKEGKRPKVMTGVGIDTRGVGGRLKNCLDPCGFVFFGAVDQNSASYINRCQVRVSPS